jgi:hypothetical protein
MRIIRRFYLVFFLMGIISCAEENNGTGEKISVKEYIRLLKSDNYTASDLPAFTADDIPALLVYRNETELIGNFPRNPISSSYVKECKLGMYVLWTIESIRAVSINSQYLIQRFPTQQPAFTLRNGTEFKAIQDDLSHQIAAKAYYDWWENHKNQTFNRFSNIDPLATTDYRWH